MDFKFCRFCGNTKPVGEFSKDKYKNDGLSTKCKSCVKEYKAANKEAISAQRKEYREQHKDEIKAYMTSYRKTYRQLNKERLAEKSLEWARNNPERRKQIARISRVKNKETSNSVTRKRRALIKGSTGSHTKQDIAFLMNRQRKMCACCGKSLKNGYHVDHIEPLSKGGSNDRLNLQLLCPTCNVSKGARDPVEFMQSRGFLC